MESSSMLFWQVDFQKKLKDKSINKYSMSSSALSIQLIIKCVEVIQKMLVDYDRKRYEE